MFLQPSVLANCKVYARRHNRADFCCILRGKQPLPCRRYRIHHFSRPQARRARSMRSRWTTSTYLLASMVDAASQACSTPITKCPSPPISSKKRLERARKKSKQAPPICHSSASSSRRPVPDHSTSMRMFVIELLELFLSIGARKP